MQSVYPYKILFVEDEEATRKNYVTYLKMLFVDVFEAEDGEEAYKIYKEKKPDIMIIDINIPKLNGLELLGKIRLKDQQTKALMLTAHTDTDFLLSAASLKLTNYLVKPVSRKALKSAIEEVIAELSQFEVLSRKTIFLQEDYYWDVDKEELVKHNKSITLTKKEKKVLQCLLSTVNRTFTSEEIVLFAWENFDEGNDNTLKQIIKKLRLKLPRDTIENVFGVGYRLVIRS